MTTADTVRAGASGAAQDGDRATATGAPGGAGSPVRTRRRPVLVAMSILFVVVGALLMAWLVTMLGDTQPVVGVRQNVARGEVIEESDLVVLDLAGAPGLDTVPGSRLSTLVGKRAAQDLSAGGVVTPGQVTDEVLPADGESVVGVSLTRGQLPATPLLAGDTVRVVFTPGQQDDVPRAQPQTVTATVVSPGVADDQGQVVVDVSVPQISAARLAAAVATGRVAVVLDSNN
ncbi:hypothetical protein KIH74_30095 [Kineosporia sp. J2-2]|uniref:SAF domain-containing protein n=1 Tax=Kineosporia corallincola TaxID=2835133 RepID=A0ABS5TR01_9ACTN|nr:SAF domain-containing protein [Kineosporia corallincola]MBT0773234.1 hypothetical protein [Kineosporia corallincola]